MKKRLLSLLLTSVTLVASAETIGSVSTTFKMLSPNDKVGAEHLEGGADTSNGFSAGDQGDAGQQQ